MDVAAEATRNLTGAPGGRSGWLGSRISGIIVAAVAMTAAANCFLKYVWWTACYSAWRGIPKLAAQWQAAGTRASFYGWSLLILEVASVAILFILLRSRSGGVVGNGLRLVASAGITLVGTGVLAWVVSLLKQGAS
ncbi:MAG TPA: hypothetical protein VGS78_15585 [Candidatus Sulfotelmatobacter sp.]|nr:hypothetical protein [Candidatus Sulfotelmatobacter sp.]